MQQNLIKESLVQQDPFEILKNHRKKFIRPKAKYVRKMPLPLRKKRTESVVKSVQIQEYKNERKMTADQEIEELLDLPPNDSFIIPVQEDSKQEGEVKKFFDELVELDFALPLSEKMNHKLDFIFLGLQNQDFMDFLSGD